MIKIYCKEGDENHITQCLAYNSVKEDKCIPYNSCNECPYYEYNIQIINHNLDRIIIETDSADELDIKTCIYNTFHNFQSCGMVNSEIETCSDCRFWYENIEVRRI